MNAEAQKKQVFLFRLFILAGLILMAVAYFSPSWWVSLKAPQYPAVAFPDGIRIHFHMDGVFNGCKFVESTEILEEETLDCKHEMDAINHYVGMYPIAAGAPVERVIAPFVVALFGLMLVASMLRSVKTQTALLAAGSIIIAAWMAYALYGQGGVNVLSPGYLHNLTDALHVDRAEIGDWSGVFAIEKSYLDALGRYFGNVPENAERAAFIVTITNVMFGALILAMVVLVAGIWKLPVFQWLLILVPAMLPVFFVIDYAGWLWWFGHNLNEMGAFTVKPFMPTVFGQGKVAQFSTYSYPHYGFGLMVGMSACLFLAFLLRLKLQREASASAVSGRQGLKVGTV